MNMWKDDKYLYVPEFGSPKLEYEQRDQSYFVKATMELTGRVRAYEISKVLEALEAEGYEVRKKEKVEPCEGNLLSAFGAIMK